MKNKLFNLFSHKSITKDDEYAEIPTNFIGFFVMLKRKFWNISNLNLVYTLCNIPVFFFLFAVTHYLDKVVYTINSPMQSVFAGIEAASSNPFVSAYFPVVSGYGVSYTPTTATYIFYALGALLIFTFGLSNVGAAYCIRGYNRGDPIFIFSDFFSCIKRNLKQGLIVGILDVIFCAVLFWDLTFWMSGEGFVNMVLMFAAIFLVVIYFIMRFYIYTLVITFDLSIYKIFKNSFLMALLGIKRNALAVIGIFILFYLNVFIFYLYPPIGLMLPFIITFGIGMFMSGYASYPVIKKYMIDPFYSNEEEESGEDDEPVFEDRG